MLMGTIIAQRFSQNEGLQGKQGNQSSLISSNLFSNCVIDFC